MQRQASMMLPTPRAHQVAADTGYVHRYVIHIINIHISLRYKRIYKYVIPLT